MKLLKPFISVFLFFCSFGNELSAQVKFFTRTGEVSFYSKATLENIKAINKQLSCIYDIKENRIVAKVLIKAFKFEKALMQEHFNENYLESDKYPKAIFKGKISESIKISGKTSWQKTVFIEGNLTIHGVTKPIKERVNLSLKEGEIVVKTTFYININDYEIDIPSTVMNNISEKVKITINFKMKQLKK